MRNQLLEIIGLKEYGVAFCDDPADERQEQWKKEREEWGFDSRETWCLDKMFAEWLFSRLWMHKLARAHNYEANYFCLHDQPQTIYSCIDEVLDKTKEYLTGDYPMFEDAKYLMEASHLFGKILPILSSWEPNEPERILKAQREDNSFDETEFHNIPLNFIQWFYPRLKMYDEINIVDTQKETLEVEGETWTFQECIDTLLANCQKYLEKPDNETLADIMKVFEVTIPALWW